MRSIKNTLDSLDSTNVDAAMPGLSRFEITVFMDPSSFLSLLPKEPQNYWLVQILAYAGEIARYTIYRTCQLFGSLICLSRVRSTTFHKEPI